MPVFSKPICVTGDCWDLIHPWQPSCVKASIEVLLNVLRESLKIYASFYVITGILQRKGPRAFLKESIPGIFRSTLFLMLNGGFLLFFMCIYRRLLGGFYYWSVLFGPALICSTMAILVERKERRGTLALYILVQLTESLFNILKSKKWIRHIPYGEIMVFAIASALSMRDFSIHGNGFGLIGAFLRLLLTPKFPHSITKHLPQAGMTGWISNVAQITVWSFIVGYVIKLMYGMISLVPKGPRSWFKTEDIRRRLVDKWNVRLAMFCACYAGGYKVVSKVLGAVGVTGSLNATIAGAVAAVSMVFYRSPTLAVYSFFKSLQSLAVEGSTMGYIKAPPHMDIIVYALATTLLMHIGIFEPLYIKQSYYHFLIGLYRGRIQDFNFSELQVWNPESAGFVENWKRTHGCTGHKTATR